MQLAKSEREREWRHEKLFDAASVEVLKCIKKKIYRKHRERECNKKREIASLGCLVPFVFVYL